jgi:hypothetical protein
MHFFGHVTPDHLPAGLADTTCVIDRPIKVHPSSLFTVLFLEGLFQHCLLETDQRVNYIMAFPLLQSRVFYVEAG